MTRAPTQAEILVAAIRAELRDVHVCLPGKVTRYDAAKQQADIQPLLKVARTDEDEARIVEDLPVITNVPVVFPGAGGYRITFPVAKGDTGVLLFSEASLDTWLAQGGSVDSKDDRRLSLADGIFLPGLRDFAHALTSAPTDHATIGKDDGKQIHLRPGEICVGDEAGSDFLARAQKVLDELNALKTHFDAVEAVITGAPIAEPGNGAPSAFQAALLVAVNASPYPAPASVATDQAKGH